MKLFLLTQRNTLIWFSNMEDQIRRLIKEKQHEGAKIVIVSGGGRPSSDMIKQIELAGISADSIVIDEYAGAGFCPAYVQAYSQLSELEKQLMEAEEVPLFKNRAASRAEARRKQHG